MASNIRVNAVNDGDNSIIAAPGAGKRIVIVNGTFTGQTTAGVALLRSGAAGTIHGDLSLGTSGGVSIPGTAEDPAFVLDANQAFVINCSAGLDVRGIVNYTIVNG